MHYSEHYVSLQLAMKLLHGLVLEALSIHLKAQAVISLTMGNVR